MNGEAIRMPMTASLNLANTRRTQIEECFDFLPFKSRLCR